jgi:DNA-directed RNA polymerase sigma subunit (sigma70/sigma32)
MIFEEDREEEILLLSSGKIISLDEREGKCKCRDIECKDCADDYLIKKESLEIDLELVLGKLKGKQRYVLSHFFGIDHCDVKTEDQIANDIGGTKDKVIHLKQKAIDKIKSDSFALNLLRSHLC